MDQLGFGAVAPRGNYPRPYQRISDAMRAQIADGRLRPGERLPTIAVLQDDYAIEGRPVAKNTVRNALDLLRDEGLVEMKGRSLYVSERRDG